MMPRYLMNGCRPDSPFQKGKLITDERLDLLGRRFQANRIFNLMGLTFGEYLDSPQQYDQIAAHLEAGGGCRIEGEQYIINPEASHA